MFRPRQLHTSCSEMTLCGCHCIISRTCVGCVRAGIPRQMPISESLPVWTLPHPVVQVPKAAAMKATSRYLSSSTQSRWSPRPMA
eukprot:4595942-Amphidinium_carterae.2